MVNVKFNDLFGSDFQQVEKSVQGIKKGFMDENLYSPKPTDSKKGVYTALIRFIPHPSLYASSIIHKVSYYFKDVNGENGIYVDSPESVNGNCPIGNLRARLWKTNNASLIELAKKNASKESKYWTTVYILKDPQHPEYEGRAMIMKFGKKLFDKYLAASTGNEFEDEEGFAANHIVNGKNLHLVVKLQDGYVNYDDSSFGTKCPLKIEDIAVTDSDKGRELLQQMYDNAPDITEYEYKPWDETTTEKVLRNIKSYEGILKSAGIVPVDDDGNNPVEDIITQKFEKQSAIPTPTATPTPTPTATPKPSASPAPTPAPTANAGKNDDLYDEIADLDL